MGPEATPSGSGQEGRIPFRWRTQTRSGNECDGQSGGAAKRAVPGSSAWTGARCKPRPEGRRAPGRPPRGPTSPGTPRDPGGRVVGARSPPLTRGPIGVPESDIVPWRGFGASDPWGSGVGVASRPFGPGRWVGSVRPSGRLRRTAHGRSSWAWRGTHALGSRVLVLVAPGCGPFSGEGEALPPDRHPPDAGREGAEGRADAGLRPGPPGFFRAPRRSGPCIPIGVPWPGRGRPFGDGSKPWEARPAPSKEHESAARSARWAPWQDAKNPDGNSRGATPPADDTGSAGRGGRPGRGDGSPVALRPVRRQRDGRVLRSRRSQPLVHTGVRGGLRARVHIWFPPGSLAFRGGRESLVPHRGSTMVARLSRPQAMNTPRLRSYGTPVQPARCFEGLLRPGRAA